MTTATKITYTSASGDLEAFHRRFDEALEQVSQASGQLHPFYIDGLPIKTDEDPLVARQASFASGNTFSLPL
jgi:hypothetical protein